MDAVEKRHYQVSRVFRRYTQRELVRRGCHGTHIQVSSSGTAGFVCDMLRQSLREGTLLSLGAVLQRISAYDPIWARFSDILPEKDKPRDFQDLGHLFHVHYVVRPALPSTKVQNADLDPTTTNPLLITIDDIVERRIYIGAQKLLKRICTVPKPSGLLEIYPCRRAFRDNNQTRMCMYRHDPSPERLDVHMCKCRRALATIVDLNGRGGQNGDMLSKAGPSKNKLDPFGVLGMLNGGDVAAALRKICMEEGLIS